MGLKKEPNAHATPLMSQPPHIERLRSQIYSALVNETQICMNRPLRNVPLPTHLPAWRLATIVGGWLTDALHLAQFALGMMVLSSALFLRVEDAVGIVLRLVASATAIRAGVDAIFIYKRTVITLKG
jgi:hypothetical protein